VVCEVLTDVTTLAATLAGRSRRSVESAREHRWIVFPSRLFFSGSRRWRAFVVTRRIRGAYSLPRKSKWTWLAITWSPSN